jgi:hypothetical protein
MLHVCIIYIYIYIYIYKTRNYIFVAYNECVYYNGE